MTATLTTHVWLDEKGVAWIDDTNVKVIEVVLDKSAYGWSPEEIFFQHYGDLSLAQIHSALAYYYDHQRELEAEIERRARDGDELAREASDPIFRQRLLALKKRRRVSRFT